MLKISWRKKCNIQETHNRFSLGINYLVKAFLFCLSCPITAIMCHFMSPM